MKKFFKEQILFPKRFGFMPYFWTLSLIILTSQMLFNNGNFDWFSLFLILIFLKLYRDGYENQPLLTFDIIGQLLLSIYFSFTHDMGTLFLFTAWEIGSVRITQKKFHFYTLIYLLLITIPLGFNMIYHFNHYDSFGVIVTITFAIGSPFAARSLSNSYRRLASLNQNNKRLESIIRQNERSRIAKDLHDNLGQSFSLITLKTELADKLIDKNVEQAHSELKDIAKTSRANLTLVRQIVADLNEKTIAAAMIEEENNLQSVKIHLSSDNEDISEHWPKNIQNILASVIKEASTNIIRHSMADYVSFQFNEDNNCFYLTISDNGVGYSKIRRNAFGIQGMRQRIEDIKGTLEIQSKKGTTILIKVPKE